MNTTSSQSIDPDLPRFDLREEAFSRYELYIAKACLGEYVVDPSQLPRPVKPMTFIARFKDAIRGYKLYNYKSSAIPRNHSLVFRLAETSNGLVRISPVGIEKPASPKFDRIAALVILKQLADGTRQGPYQFEGMDDSDLAWLEELKKTLYIAFDKRGDYVIVL